MDFWHDKKLGILVYPTQNPFLLQALPEAKAIGRDQIGVPFNLHNAQVLRHFNYPVPPIITDENYDWPAPPGQVAGEHQKLMANFDVLHRKAFNLSDPGSQKTLAKIWFADWLMSQYPPGECRALIVCPMTIMETVWATTIFRALLSKRSVEILHGDASKRSALLAKKPDFGIINFDGVGVGALTRKRFELAGFSADLANDDKIKIIIIDEADAYCDAQTKRHRIARLIFGKRDYLLLQTGTPLGNSPANAYGLAKLVNGCFGKSFTAFRAETMFQVAPRSFKWLPRSDGYEKARRVLVPAIRFSIEEVWKNAPELLPPQVRKVPLTDEQEKALTSLKKDLQIQLKTGQLVNATNEAAARTKYLQIALGAIYDANHETHLIDATPRYVEIKYLVKRSAHKVLIFTALTSVVHLLYKTLSKDWRCGIINGEVSQKERVRLIRAFESEPDFKVMIMDPQPTAHGINEFVVADTVIWCGPTEKSRLYEQGNKRAHRPGQKHPVSIYQVVGTKLEQEIFHRVESNISLQGALLEAVRKGEL
jgi:SNF2 family DNA or RNA helicase